MPEQNASPDERAAGVSPAQRLASPASSPNPSPPVERTSPPDPPPDATAPDDPRHHLAAPRLASRAADIAFPALAFLLAAGATALCREAAGISLGLFFGGVAFATLLVPPLTAGEASPLRRLLIPAAVVAGVSAVWLWAVGEFLTPGQWLACSAVLAAYTLALAGVCVFLTTLRCNPIPAGAVVTTAALLWLTWPVWLSHALLGPAGDALVAWLVPAHPLFAVNGVLVHFDTWDRYPLAYGTLTVLNQDVFYRLPPSILPAMLLHAAVAVAGFAAPKLARGRRARPGSQLRVES